MGRQNVQAQVPRCVENAGSKVDCKGNYGNHNDDNDNDVFIYLATCGILNSLSAMSIARLVFSRPGKYKLFYPGFFLCLCGG